MDGLFTRLNFTYASSLSSDLVNSLGFNFARAPNFSSGLGNLLGSNSEFLNQPHVRMLALVWVITFTIVMAFIMRLGFGRAGVVSGSLAAAFQSRRYGGFTPSSGLFASLTSLGMLGYTIPAGAVIAAVVSTSVALIVSGSFRR